jgi:hypothetical protein
MKLIKDILQEVDGKWSIKRVIAFISLFYAFIYEGLAMFFELPSKEYVFSGLLLLVASSIGLTVWANKIRKD